MKIFTEKGFNDPYEQVSGDSPFAKAVNETVRQEWVSSGKQIPMEAAMWEVLADFYNKLNS